MWIKELKPGSVFVYGSNLAGRNGKGAALTAKQLFGAVDGIGQGPTGQCYAIPTKDAWLQTLSLKRIQAFVYVFIGYAIRHPELEFLVTPIGTGPAGYSPADIAPMFRTAMSLTNVKLPPEFLEVLNRPSGLGASGAHLQASDP